MAGLSLRAWVFDVSLTPVTVIEAPRKIALGAKIREVCEHRELLMFLVWRDVKVRYKQTLLGAAWAVLQPLATAVVFTLFFGRVAGISSDGLPYSLFSYAGLLIWTFFAQSLSQSSQSLVGSANLITKVYFPRLIIPLAAVMGDVSYCQESAPSRRRCDGGHADVIRTGHELGHVRRFYDRVGRNGVVIRSFLPM